MVESNLLIKMVQVKNGFIHILLTIDLNLSSTFAHLDNDPTILNLTA
jgi:hypothetical protein